MKIYPNKTKKSTKNSKIPFYLRIIHNGKKSEARLNVSEISEEYLKKWSQETQRFNMKLSREIESIRLLNNKFQFFENVLTLDAEDDFLVSTEVGDAGVHLLDAPALALGEAGVHAVEVGAKQGRLGPAGSRSDFHDRVARVGGFGGNDAELQLQLQLGVLLLKQWQFLLGQFRQFGFGWL